MPEGVEEIAGMFGREIAPSVAPRDQRGEPLVHTNNPEPMFAPRPIEGDPITGDTRDGGEDPRFRAREKEIADGDEDSTRGRVEVRKDVAQPGADDGHELEETEQDDEGELQSVDEERQVDDGEKHEFVVDGKRLEITTAEAVRGYIRQVTFHNRMAQLNQRSQELEGLQAQVQQNWTWWHKARAEYEEDLANLIPQEPNWDQEFAVNPANARMQQKAYQALYTKLQLSQQARAQRQAADIAEEDRRTKKYAVDGYTKFVMDHLKDIPDEKTLEKNIKSMKRTAAASGFNDQEIATVFDPRMLDILWKASRFDRMTANPLKAVVPGRGKTLTPGAATPLSSGNGRRKGLDDAQRQLASSGRLDDAAEVFRRML